MANRDGTQCDFDFIVFRCAQVDILDMQGFAKFMAYGGFDAGHFLSSLIFHQFGTDRRRRKPEIVINGRNAALFLRRDAKEHQERDQNQDARDEKGHAREIKRAVILAKRVKDAGHRDRCDHHGQGVQTANNTL